MENRSLVTIAEHSKEKILYMLEMAKEFEAKPNRHLLDEKVVATLFFEPSTRTRLSFETAANRLGARVIGFSDPKATSSSKGETLKYTILNLTVHRLVTDERTVHMDDIGTHAIRPGGQQCDRGDQFLAPRSRLIIGVDDEQAVLPGFSHLRSERKT